MRMRIVCTVLGVVVAGLACEAVAQVNEDTPGYFPFWIPALDDTGSFTDMSFLNPEPAGASGRARIRDGHFYDANGKRLRLLGTNLVFQGAFPEKEYAAAMAGHLQKLGFNIIRFHHMDTMSAPCGIWLPGFYALDPDQVDKLDWLIYQLKQHGIYTNLNLHVSYTYPGIPESAPGEFLFGKGLDNFYPPYIQAQKEYAAALLTHRNPYTNTMYTEEPAVLVMEINNENALTNIPWNALRAMPEAHMQELTRQWRQWLAAHYPDTATLRKRWDEASEPLGDELLANGAFAEGTEHWTLEQGQGSAMTAKSIEDSGTGSGRALEVATEKPGGLAWSLQIHQTGLDLEDEVPYTLEFMARADVACNVGVSAMLDQAPWSVCGLRLESGFDTEWRHFRYTFKCGAPVANHCRISFNLNNRVGRFWLADVSLRRGGLVGLPEDQSLEGDNIPIPPAGAGDAESADFWAFLSETECRYVEEMKSYLRESLGVESFLCDTQATYGGLLGMYREATHSDYVDMHAYWQHPYFPGKSWDDANWFIENTSMVTCDRGGQLASLAWTRCLDKPFTVSEYDHPNPNDHAVELFPMIASFAAAQDWDGIYQFDYRGSAVDPDDRHLWGFFELWNHPGKQAFLPIAALMFRMDTINPKTAVHVLEIPQHNLPTHALNQARHNNELAEVYADTLLDRVGYRLVDGDGPPRIPELPQAGGAEAGSPAPAIVWEPNNPDGATYIVNAPAVRAVVGYIGGREIAIGDVTIRVTKATGNWAAVAVGALDGKPLAESSRILVVAVGRIENVDMGWNEERTSVSKQWGHGPVLAEGIEATVSLPNGAHVAALDGTGTPKGEVESQRTASGIAFAIGPKYATLWYAVTP